MGRPATQNQAGTGVQKHHEARGEASHNTTATGADGQGADKPRVQPTTEAELMLQAEGDKLCAATHSNLFLPEVLFTPNQVHAAERPDPLFYHLSIKQRGPLHFRSESHPPGFAAMGDLSPKRTTPLAFSLQGLSSLLGIQARAQGTSRP